MSEAQGQGQAAAGNAGTQGGDSNQGQGQQQQEQAAPFFVAKTQDDFNKKAGLERESLRNAALRDEAESAGYDSVEAMVEAAKTQRQAEELTQTEVEKRDKKIAKLEPVAQKAERYEQSLTMHLESQREGLPEHITTLLDKMDPADQLDYITEHGESLRTPEEAKPRVNAPQTSGTGVNGQANVTDPQQAHANFIAGLLGGS